MQRQFQQFVELFVPLVLQFVDRMVDISCIPILVRTVHICAADRGDLTGTVLGWLWTRLLFFNDRCHTGFAGIDTPLAVFP